MVRSVNWDRDGNPFRPMSGPHVANVHTTGGRGKGSKVLQGPELVGSIDIATAAEANGALGIHADPVQATLLRDGFLWNRSDLNQGPGPDEYNM